MKFILPILLLSACVTASCERQSHRLPANTAGTTVTNNATTVNTSHPDVLPNHIFVRGLTNDEGATRCTLWDYKEKEYIIVYMPVEYSRLMNPGDTISAAILASRLNSN